MKETDNFLKLTWYSSAERDKFPDTNVAILTLSVREMIKILFDPNLLRLKLTLLQMEILRKTPYLYMTYL